MGRLLSQEGVIGKAAAAMCLAAINIKEDKAWIRENSLRYYTEALHDMNVALSRPRKDGGVGFASAISIFSTFEVRN